MEGPGEEEVICKAKQKKNGGEGGLNSFCIIILYEIEECLQL